MGMEVNVKYAVVSRDRHAEQNHNINVGNNSFEGVEQFKYVETSYQNPIDGIKSRLKSWKAAYYSVQNLLSSSFLSNNVKIKIYKSIIVNGVFFGRRTWSLSHHKKP
jgi:hypothetical protein